MARRKKSSRKRMAHPGFARTAASIARRQGIPVQRARAILAAGARKASPAARRRNPRLRRVSGVPGYRPVRRRRRR